MSATVATGQAPRQPLTDRVLDTLRSTGLEVGVATADPFLGTRAELLRRRDAGLHGGMAFTYRDPERATDPSRSVAGARSLVVGALGYLRAAPERPASTAPGRVARYAWTDHYAELTDRLALGADVLRESGHAAVVLVDQNALVDREAAHRAGIGWYGRNANLLLPGRGSWFVLGTIVTDAALTPSPAARGGCGSCTRCVPACPTGAIVSPGVVDARRCLSWLLQATGPFPPEHREALGDRIYGCDDCQEVCPPNRVAAAPASAPPESPPESPLAPAPRAWVDVLDLLDDDDAAVLHAAGRWYVAERNPRYLRRNALVVLGNTAAPDDSRALAALVRCLHHPDPLIRGHAVWAAARLGRPDLADGLAASEADPMVRAELEGRAAVAARA